MLRLAAAPVVNRTVSNDDIEVLGESRRNHSQTNQRVFHGAIEKSRTHDVDLKLLGGFFEQDRQLIFPKGGERMAAVAARLVAQRKNDRAAVWNAFDFALENSEVGR